MTPNAVLVVFLATLTISCRAVPLNEKARREISSSTSSPSTSTSPRTVSSTSPPPPSATQNTTSIPTLTVVPNWEAYANGTRGYALNQLLSRISSDAPQRWVTADIIASTRIGGSDPAGSNADLNAAVNTVFTDESNRTTWVDTYIDFLIEAGESYNSLHGKSPNETRQQIADAQIVWGEEQVKLVRAYEAAHPGNFTYVGIDIANFSKVDALTLGAMEGWAMNGGDANCSSNASGNLTLSGGENSTNATAGGTVNCTLDSDGTFYTKEDWNKFLNASSDYFSLPRMLNDSITGDQIGNLGYSLQRVFPKLGISNLSMEIAAAGPETQFSPAWAATIMDTSFQNAESDLKVAFSDATSNSTIDLIKRDGDPSRQEFAALQFVAGMNPTATDSNSLHVPAVAAAAPKSAVGEGDPLNQPLAGNENLVLVTLQEGDWARSRTDFIRYARQNPPHVADKYFGPGNSGSGPIGKHWTHLVLIMCTESGEVRAELLGKVWEVLPGL